MEKTVAVRLKGGLGNQLFQYAAGRFLAQSWNRELVLLTDFLKHQSDNYTARNFELDQFGLNALLADPETEKKIIQDSLLKKIGVLKKPLLISEANFFSAKRTDQQVILDGYFQSEKYFASIRSVLIKEIKHAFIAHPENKQQLETVKNPHNSVAIHVRRGDYVTLPSAANYHGALEMDYFNKAIDFLRQPEKDLHFMVFSDDVTWCKENFPATSDYTFQSASQKRSAADLILMSYCKHQVISNSSYSWWAAWLNEDPDKCVIAPKNWFKDREADSADIYCNGWIRL